VWWAIRSEPRPPEPAVAGVRVEPEPHPGWRFSRHRPPRSGRGPHGAPTRGYRRKVARAGASW
jgi:hypothetical protein